MIVVKVEIWPFGDGKSRREIGRMRIANDGSGTMGIGNYRFTIDPLTDRTVSGSVCSHQRSRGVWELLRACLEAAKENL